MAGLNGLVRLDYAPWRYRTDTVSMGGPMGGVDQMVKESLDLEAIEARANAATEGPWLLDHDWAAVVSPPDSVVHGYFLGTCPACGDLFEEDASVAMLAEDAEFIAHAREDVPALIAEVRRLREAADDIRAGARERIAAEIEADRLPITASPGSPERSWQLGHNKGLADAAAIARGAVLA